jgi:ABC-type transport system involved in cytochrome bd biosynthesis fused ATPase/permease subunit
MSDDWAKNQLEPLGMFELASRWTDALKTLGAGNAAGIFAAGAALNTPHGDLSFWIKFAGAIFFIGVFSFAAAFAFMHTAVFSYDEMLHAIKRKDEARSHEMQKATSSQMMTVNRLAIVSALSFFVGCILGMFVLLRL